jgi:hypothetical protein
MNNKVLKRVVGSTEKVKIWLRVLSNLHWLFDIVRAIKSMTVTSDMWGSYGYKVLVRKYERNSRHKCAGENSSLKKAGHGKFNWFRVECSSGLLWPQWVTIGFRNKGVVLICSVFALFFFLKKKRKTLLCGVKIHKNHKIFVTVLH